MLTNISLRHCSQNTEVRATKKVNDLCSAEVLLCAGLSLKQLYCWWMLWLSMTYSTAKLSSSIVNTSVSDLKNDKLVVSGGNCIPDLVSCPDCWYLRLRNHNLTICSRRFWTKIVKSWAFSGTDSPAWSDISKSFWFDRAE